jgi:hypothetical protein
VSARHLRDQQGDFEIPLQQEYSDPNNELAEQVDSCELFLDGKQIELKPLVKRQLSGSHPVIEVSTRSKIFVKGEVTVKLKTVSASVVVDNTEVIFARYPTKGFRAMMMYRADRVYDAAWFRVSTTIPYELSGREPVEVITGGIVASTSDWLLPGNGVILYWYPAADKVANNPEAIEKPMSDSASQIQPPLK